MHAVLLLAATLTFPDALERALHTRGATEFYDTRASALESARTLPSIRAETGASSANDLNLITSRVTRVDALTALITLDYPLLGNSQQELRDEAALLRDRAAREEDDVFRDTLDAFARLYLADARLDSLRDSAARARTLREHADTMLAAGLITNNVAAQWQDQALAAESMLVDLQLQRLDAETRLKQLMGDRSEEPLHVVLDSGAAAASAADSSRDSGARSGRRSTVQVETRGLRKPQLLMSAFGGVANVSDGTFGLYGIRFMLSLPMFDASAQRRILQAEERSREREIEETAQRNRIELLRVATSANEKRLALLAQAVDVARQREQSVTRLVRAGVRAEGDALDAMSEVARRESALVEARVEGWKLEQQLRRDR
ncbi:MAG: hypothetical protein DMF56_11570 [Acidobacteria bacterium]|nr:MAG: hypothetical protein DMF56_11570 [Acidobacteriota bacterium]